MPDASAASEIAMFMSGIGMPTSRAIVGPMFIAVCANSQNVTTASTMPSRAESLPLKTPGAAAPGCRAAVVIRRSR